MTLIKSISGIRGTIGGRPDDGLTPLDIVKFVSAYGTWVRTRNKGARVKIVVGRDARISGPMVDRLVIGTLSGLGIDVLQLGLSTTPTVEVAVTAEGAHGGIILTASHNPRQWNALKLLNERGEFISAADGSEVLDLASNESFAYAEVDDLGQVEFDDLWIDKHIDMIMSLDGVDREAIEEADLSVVCDCVNSTGGLAVPALLSRLGVKKVTELYCTPNGDFPHNPEPLPENLTDLSASVKENGAHLGIVVDPDVDRLALVCEDGSMFGEEYTLVAVADHVMGFAPGPTSSNLSSSRALRDVTESHGQRYEAAAVGEVNVVTKMKEIGATIGGEGNGGVIYPSLHYGRDSLVGIALFLTHYVKKGKKMTELRDSYPKYHMAKKKIRLTEGIDVDDILVKVQEKFEGEEVTTIDGVKIDFENEWVHLRKSNTEPIIRIYSESGSQESADSLADDIIQDIEGLI